jgi:quercetin dioxygenase-like cupin family protein
MTGDGSPERMERNMNDKVNLSESSLSSTSTSVRGSFVWHSHPDTDDFFLVLDGEPGSTHSPDRDARHASAAS